MKNKSIERVDMRESAFQKTASEMTRCRKLCFKINNTEPMTEELRALEQELFDGRLNETSCFMPPMQIVVAGAVVTKDVAPNTVGRGWKSSKSY